MTCVVIAGGGFAGLEAAKQLGRSDRVDVVLVDVRNHHLFQPLLYQVAMAGLSPAEIAAPIRSLLSRYPRVSVRQEAVRGVDVAARTAHTDSASLAYDYLLLATGARDHYFGHDTWARFAPGLKSLAQATSIRRRVLHAFERAELETDRARMRALLTFTVVGGGPTGVELAGALGEMSRFTLARDFRHIDPTLARIVLIEAGPRILPMFSERLASRATRDLETLGVQVWTASAVTAIDAAGVQIGRERLESCTVLWAAGVRASALGASLGAALDPQGRVIVGRDLAVPDHPELFVAGDLASSRGADGRALPGLAPVALQQGAFVAQAILSDLGGRPRGEFQYRDKGSASTVGRSRAVVAVRGLEFSGTLAWCIWLAVHLYYLVGFKNRIFVVLQWAWAYLRFQRGARLIVEPEDDPLGGQKPALPQQNAQARASLELAAGGFSRDAE
jgi:NADH dehydrogenase